MKALRFSISLIKIFLLIFFPAVNAALAQKTKMEHSMTTDEARVAKKDASTLFNLTNYSEALKGYQDLVKADPSNTEFNYRLGYCYLLSNVNRSKAVDYFEVAAKSKNPKKEITYFLGLAYMYAERWDDAIKSFGEYKTISHSKPVKDFPDVERQIEMCVNGKELTAHPVNVTFENVGKAINTSEDDYNPFVSADGKTLVFTSRRKGNMGGFIEDLGMYPADTYWSAWKDTAWTKAKSTGAGINTEWDEESVGLSADGKTMFAFFDNAVAPSDIATAVLKGKTWQKAVLVGPPVNTKDLETGACMTLDGSTIYFASDRNMKYGSDLFMSRRKDNNEWGPAENLGAVINTKFDEDAPFISMDGKTLFFSSKGHNSMGGFDIFRSTYNDATESWSEPVNIGYPINNVYDNNFFCMTGDQRNAYVTAVRDEGLGDQDIYLVTYKDTSDHPFLALISGVVASESNGKVELLKVTLTSRPGNLEVMTYKPFSPGNEFVLAAKPGEYTITVEGYHFQAYNENITIPNEYPLKDIVKKIIVKTGKQ